MIGLVTSPARCSEAVNNLIEVLQKFQLLSDKVDQVGRLLIIALSEGQKLLTCGNGGSAADALHMAEELVGRFKTNRRSLPAICLAADPTLLTCIANDFGYENVFARQIEGLAQEGDALVLFSSSGNSPNLLAAVKAARERRVITIAVLGKDGGSLAGTTEHEIIVPAFDTARVQEVHTLILHSWLEQVEAAFAG